MNDKTVTSEDALAFADEAFRNRDITFSGRDVFDMTAALSTFLERHRSPSPPAGSDAVDFRALLIQAGRNAGAFISDRASDVFLKDIPEEVRLKIVSLSTPSQPLSEAKRAAIDAGLRAFCSETGDFDMSSQMRRAAADHIMGQPGMFPSDAAGGPMIEKMARAMIVATDPGRNFHNNPYHAVERAYYEHVIRAALAAMLAPTPAMIRSLDDEDSDPMVARGRAYSAFVTMIQAALDEPAEQQ